MNRLIACSMGILFVGSTLFACQKQEFNPNDGNDAEKTETVVTEKVVTQIREKDTPTLGPDGKIVTTTSWQTTETRIPGVGASQPVVDRLKAASPDLGLFARMLIKADLTGLLQDSNITLFAPTDAALRAMSPETLAALESNKPRLQDFVRSHVLEERTPLKKLENFKVPMTLSGFPLALTRFEDGRFFVQSSSIIAPDRPVEKALVHVIDRPLVAG